jgi:hypothetical protein
MPTTNVEAQQIAKIVREYISVDVARELFKRLDEEVGAHSDNESLRHSLAMLRLMHT